MSTAPKIPDNAPKQGPVRWGVLGASNFALRVSLPGMRRGPLTELRALASRDLGKAREAAQSLGIPKAYGSYEELLADPEIEAIYNPLPNHLHVEWTARAARAGKHVLCEKPIALDAKQAETLLAVQKETGKLISEAFMIRNHPQWRQAKEWVTSGRIGELVSIQTAFSYFNRDGANIRNKKDVGGGALYDIGCYTINLSRMLFGGEPDDVLARVVHDPALGVDVLTSAILGFGDGVATFTVSTRVETDQRVDVYGAEGRISIDIPFNIPPDRPTRVRVVAGGDAPVAPAEEVLEFATADPYAAEADAFAAAVLDEAPVPVPPEDAVSTLRVIERVFATAGG
jgi:predicted dehydrogenase